MKQKILTVGTLLPVILILDVVTKRWALDALAGGRQIQVIEGFLPLTLAYNQGAAFGLSIGSNPRLVFIPITLVALGLLGTLYVRAERGDLLRLLSLSLVMAGALGNLFDRLRWDRGVVDFVGPINLGFADFPIFNVADMSISCGAVLLAISFWMEERRELAAQAAAAEAAGRSSIEGLEEPLSTPDTVPEV